METSLHNGKVDTSLARVSCSHCAPGGGAVCCFQRGILLDSSETFCELPVWLSERLVMGLCWGMLDYVSNIYSSFICLLPLCTLIFAFCYKLSRLGISDFDTAKEGEFSFIKGNGRIVNTA